MPKATYPIVFTPNDDFGAYTAFIPDLAILAQGKTLEEAYSQAEDVLKKFISLSIKHNTYIPDPSKLEEISKKWGKYKISLITANY